MANKPDQDAGTLGALNRSDGSTNWEYQTTGNVESEPAVADGTVYADDSEDRSRRAARSNHRTTLPAVKGGRQDNILQFGPSGTGKSLIINATAEEVATLCENRGVDFGVIRINCQRISSEDKAVYAMLEDVSEKTGTEVGIQKTGNGDLRQVRPPLRYRQ